MTKPDTWRKYAEAADTRLLCAIVIVLAIIVRQYAPLDADIYWLLTCCRRMLDGAQLYRDIVETNPPMAVFLYWPAAALERRIHLPAEAIFTALTLAGGTLAAWRFTRIAGLGKYGLVLCLFLLLIAPLTAFGEREHIALMLGLPILGVVIRRARGQGVRWQWIVASGVLAGLMAMIKPHLALPVLTAYLWLAIHRRSVWLLLSPEALIAAACALLYTAWVYLFMPAYIHDTVPLLVELYRPMRKPLLMRLTSGYVLLWGAALLALWVAQKDRRFEPLPAALLAMSAGFMLAFFDQGRLLPYHAYPAAALLALAAPHALSGILTQGQRGRLIGGVALAATIGIFGNLCFFGYHGGGVVAPIRAVIAHPTMMSITFDQVPGHPIVTEAGGTWAGTYSSRWITVNARYLMSKTTDPAKRARLQHWLDFDRAAVNHDLARKPDIVLVGQGPFDWNGWLAADPETHCLMSDYVLLASDELTPEARQAHEGIQAWIRKDAGAK